MSGVSPCWLLSFLWDPHARRLWGSWTHQWINGAHFCQGECFIGAVRSPPTPPRQLNSRQDCSVSARKPATKPRLNGGKGNNPTWSWFRLHMSISIYLYNIYIYTDYIRDNGLISLSIYIILYIYYILYLYTNHPWSRHLCFPTRWSMGPWVDSRCVAHLLVQSLSEPALMAPSSPSWSNLTVQTTRLRWHQVSC